MKKKFDIRLLIIPILVIILTIMLFFYFKGEKDYNSYEFNTTNEKTETKEGTTITASSQVSSALTEEIRLHATYYFKKLLVSENQLVKKGTKIIEYTNGKYLKAPYDLVITNTNIPSKNEICTVDHYIKVSSYNVLSVSFRISEEKMDKVSLGKKVKIKIPALNDKEYDGYVTSISSTAENGKFVVTAEFDNDGETRIGMSANVSL